MTDFFGIVDKKQLEKINLILNIFDRNNDEEKKDMLKIIKELIK